MSVKVIQRETLPAPSRALPPCFNACPTITILALIALALLIAGGVLFHLHAANTITSGCLMGAGGLICLLALAALVSRAITNAKKAPSDTKPRGQVKAKTTERRDTPSAAEGRVSDSSSTSTLSANSATSRPVKKITSAKRVSTAVQPDQTSLAGGATRVKASPALATPSSPPVDNVSSAVSTAVQPGQSSSAGGAPRVEASPELATPSSPTLSTAASMLTPLPQINSIIKISNDLEINISSEILLIKGTKGNLGAATGSEVCTRELAFLLQKNSALVEEVMTCANSQDALKALAEAIKKQLPPSRVAGLCIIDGVHKTCSAEIFGNAKLRVRTQPFGVAGICEHQPGQCSHGRPPFKLQLLTLTIYTEEEYSMRHMWSQQLKFFAERYHDALPDNHWVQLKTLAGDRSMQCPHPDHINKMTNEI